ncbi:hypothetical protein HYH03_009069 [Edaphochlamys debaryana]|uniref:Uncharacterized protein n=1 Tax=Edaphochlamys debaryana TaxID=47281 RepID=A0A836BYV5_9CHLO|nr:hypothetical protein HYH03_009069 [Edaphochlamys debaryana]|eukprot:KAG2492654.1 hypothetical protein HYH03_009069 [Edaphochlamys debaryana]
MSSKTADPSLQDLACKGLNAFCTTARNVFGCQSERGRVEDAKRVHEAKAQGAFAGAVVALVAVVTISTVCERCRQPGLPSAAARKAIIDLRLRQHQRGGRLVLGTRRVIARSLPYTPARSPQWLAALNAALPVPQNPPLAEPLRVGDEGRDAALSALAASTQGFTEERLHALMDLALAQGPLLPVAGDIAQLERDVQEWREGIAANMAAGNTLAVLNGALAHERTAHILTQGMASLTVQHLSQALEGLKAVHAVAGP